MTIKYIQSSDNKYVQFRLMAKKFTTDVTDWQGIDNKPVAGSDNLLNSGGVAEAIGYFKFSNVIVLENSWSDVIGGVSFAAGEKFLLKISSQSATWERIIIGHPIQSERVYNGNPPNGEWIEVASLYSVEKCLIRIFFTLGANKCLFIYYHLPCEIKIIL